MLKSECEPNRDTLIKVRQKGGDGETELAQGLEMARNDKEINSKKKMSRLTGRSTLPGLSHTASVTSHTTLPETSARSSHTQLCDDMRVHLCLVQLCIPIREI